MNDHMLSLAALNAAAPGILDVVFGQRMVALTLRLAPKIAALWSSS